jgi:hypothetical protein
MGTISFGGLAIVAAAALTAPLALGLFPRIRLPAIVLEIVLGIVIGPHVLGWVSIDTPIQVMSLLGLALLLLLELVGLGGCSCDSSCERAEYEPDGRFVWLRCHRAAKTAAAVEQLAERQSTQVIAEAIG